MKRDFFKKIIIVQLFLCLFLNSSINTHGFAGSTYVKNMGIGWRVLDQLFINRMYEGEFVASYVINSRRIVNKKISSAGKAEQIAT